MLKRGESIVDLASLIEALYWESGPGGDRRVRSIIIEHYAKEEPRVCIRFTMEGSAVPDEFIPFERQLLIEAYREGFVDPADASLPPCLFFYSLSPRGREARNRKWAGTSGE